MSLVLQLDDEFDRTSLDPWTIDDGSASVTAGRLCSVGSATVRRVSNLDGIPLTLERCVLSCVLTGRDGAPSGDEVWALQAFGPEDYLDVRFYANGGYCLVGTQHLNEKFVTITGWNDPLVESIGGIAGCELEVILEPLTDGSVLVSPTVRVPGRSTCAWPALGITASVTIHQVPRFRFRSHNSAGMDCWIARLEA